MPKPPRPNLASIVAGAAPPARTADIVKLDTGHAPPRKTPSTLKERARQMSVYLEPPVYDQLRDLAHTERTKMHALMLEALDLLFKQRGTISIDGLNDRNQH
ncbi:ribbon-helix-helix domain-containing protein [Methylobacterium sp. 77]|uniref:ribbon-helix-helix domain-containing protein n=1 Tax=Methylobacterium sp. 77 TaxID=1101192 RepID=UPI00047BB233|nr:ribbon-helix-helix domain-containing protein [Methylobacterium sp. 77]